MERILDRGTVHVYVIKSGDMGGIDWRQIKARPGGILRLLGGSLVGSQGSSHANGSKPWFPKTQSFLTFVC